MRAIKIAGIALASLFGLAVVALLAVRLLVDPNDYKDRIAQEVKGATGRRAHAFPAQPPRRWSGSPWSLGPASRETRGGKAIICCGATNRSAGEAAAAASQGIGNRLD